MKLTKDRIRNAKTFVSIMLQVYLWALEIQVVDYWFWTYYLYKPGEQAGLQLGFLLFTFTWNRTKLFQNSPTREQ